MDRSIWSHSEKSAMCDNCSFHEDQDEETMKFEVYMSIGALVPVAAQVFCPVTSGSYFVPIFSQT